MQVSKSSSTISDWRSLIEATESELRDAERQAHRLRAALKAFRERLENGDQFPAETGAGVVGQAAD